MSNTRFDKYKAGVPELALRDPRLSAKAKGIYAYFWTNRIKAKQNRWQLYESEVTKHFKDGKDSINSGFKELMKYGYLTKTYVRNSHGSFAKGTLWHVHVKPVDAKSGNSTFGNTKLGKSESSKPVSNSYQYKTHIKSNSLQDKKTHEVRSHFDLDKNEKIREQNKSYPTSQFSKLFKLLSSIFDIKESQYTTKCINSWLVHYGYKTAYKAVMKARRSKLERNKINSPLKYIGTILRNDKLQVTKAKRSKEQAKRYNSISSSNKSELEKYKKLGIDF